jgi:hypothetical protein
LPSDFSLGAADSPSNSDLASFASPPRSRHTALLQSPPSLSPPTSSSHPTLSLSPTIHWRRFLEAASSTSLVRPTLSLVGALDPPTPTLVFPSTSSSLATSSYPSSSSPSTPAPSSPAPLTRVFRRVNSARRSSSDYNRRRGKSRSAQISSQRSSDDGPKPTISIRCSPGGRQCFHGQPRSS